MSVIEDVRKVVHDLVAPELKSLSVKLDNMDGESKLRDENLAAKIESTEGSLAAKIAGAERESKLRDEGLSAKIDNAERESKLRDEGLSAKMESWERESKLRDEITQARIDIVRDSLGARLDALGAKMDGQSASIMNALDLNRRVETLERDKQQPSA